MKKYIYKKKIKSIPKHKNQEKKLKKKEVIKITII